MKAHDRRGFEDSRGADQLSRANHRGQKARDDSVRRSQTRNALPRPIENQKLTFDQQCLRDDRACSGWAEQSNQSPNQMNEELATTSMRGMRTVLAKDRKSPIS
jgi:hypothetical protein